MLGKRAVRTLVALLGALEDPVRVDIAFARLRDILVDALSALISDPKSIVLGMGAGGIPKRQRPYLHIDALTLPAMIGTFTDEKETRCEILSKTIQIVSAVVDRDYKVRLNGLPALHVESGGQTVTQIRDALRLRIDVLGEPVSTADNGADSIDVTPNFAGAIHSLTSPSDTNRLLITEVLGTDAVTYSIGRRRFTVRIQCFSKTGRVGSGGAHQIINTAYAALDTPDAKLFLKDYRLAIRPLTPAPINATGIVAGGARNEQRALFDIAVSLGSMTVRPANKIETVEISLTLGNQTITFTQDATNPP